MKEKREKKIIRQRFPLERKSEASFTDLPTDEQADLPSDGQTDKPVKYLSNTSVPSDGRTDGRTDGHILLCRCEDASKKLEGSRRSAFLSSAAEES